MEIGLPTYLLGLKGRAVPKADVDTTVPVSLLLVFLVGWRALFALAVRKATVRHLFGVVCRAFRVLGLQRIDSASVSVSGQLSRVPQGAGKHVRDRGNRSAGSQSEITSPP